MRSEPVVFLALVEDDLQGAYAQGQKRKSDEVEAREPLLKCGYVWWIFDKLKDEYECQNTNRNVDVENPAPGVVVGDPASQRWTNGRSADGRDPIQRKGQHSLRRRKRIAQDCLRHRLQASSERALQDPKQEKKPKAGCDSAQKRTDCEKHNAGQKKALPPKESNQPATCRQNDCIGDQVAGQDPRALVITRA